MIALIVPGAQSPPYEKVTSYVVSDNGDWGQTLSEILAEHLTHHTHHSHHSPLSPSTTAALFE
jgi:hypothetical protein